MGIVPYSFDSAMLPTGTVRPAEPGIFQGVHFTCEAVHCEQILTRIERWFERRDEVILVASGTTSKQGVGFVVMEWEESEIDPLFIAILDEEELIDDYALYSRSEEV